MPNKEPEIMIPSETVRNYVLETVWTRRSRMNELLKYASLVRRGESYLSNLFYCIEKYKEYLGS